MKHIKLSLIITFIVVFVSGTVFTVANIVQGGGMTTTYNTSNAFYGKFCKGVPGPVTPRLLSPAQGAVYKSGYNNIKLYMPSTQPYDKDLRVVNVKVSQNNKKGHAESKFTFYNHQANWYMKVAPYVDPATGRTNDLIDFTAYNKEFGRDDPHHLNVHWIVDQNFQVGYKTNIVVSVDYYREIRCQTKTVYMEVFLGKKPPTFITPPKPAIAIPAPTNSVIAKRPALKKVPSTIFKKIEKDYASSNSEDYTRAPKERKDFFALNAEEKANIVFDYVQKNYPDSEVNKYLDDKEVQDMIASRVDSKDISLGEIDGYAGDSSRVTLHGTATPNSNVKLFIFSTKIIASVKSDGSGKWQYTLNQGIEEGSHEVFVAVTGSGGSVEKKSDPLPFFADMVSDSISTDSSAPKEKFYNTRVFRYLMISIGVVGFLVLAFYLVIRYVRRRLYGV